MNAEDKGLLLLKRMIGPGPYDAFRHNGFLHVAAKNGFYYQIYADGILVFNDAGVRVAALCVIFDELRNEDNNFPLIDYIVMRYLLAKSDPKRLWDTAEITRYTVPRVQPLDVIPAKPPEALT